MKQFLAWLVLYCNALQYFSYHIHSSIAKATSDMLSSSKADLMIIGEEMVYTFLKKLKGMERRNLWYDKNGTKIVQELADKAESKGVNIYFPENFVTADNFDKDHEMPWYVSTTQLTKHV